ncbi:MAG: AtpZ/AtpI family protein [bacterium]|nr:AtpZ/AtpI family protein [bacterium]
MQKKTPLSDYGKYSSIALQMAAIITILTFGGKYLDKYFVFKFPIFTLLGVFLGIFTSMYYIIKKL